MRISRLFLTLAALMPAAFAGVEVDIDSFGQSLGGWKSRSHKAADYEISDSEYRTYKPEITPSPDGGIFVSLRIDLRRGWLASDDHASLEMSFGPDARLVSAQSSLALQGRAITSDLIRDTTGAAGKVVPVPGAEHAVQMGANLAADLSSKLLREQIVEPGRVTFPAAIRHNYNLLYKAVHLRKDDGSTDKPTTAGAPTPGTPPKDPVKDPAKSPAKDPAKPGDSTDPAKPADTPTGKLEVHTFDTPIPSGTPASTPASTPPTAK